MAKVKVNRRSPSLDMTAMCDVAFLLLTFFILTTKFRPDEPVIVDTPSSVSEIKLPESDILLITVDKDSRVFFGVDKQQVREKMLEKMIDKYKLDLTPDEKASFTLVSNFGVPVANLKQFLDMKPSQRANLTQPGIPSDSLNNELADWIWFARVSNPEMRIAVKGDGKSDYKIVKKVIATLQDKKVNRFNFITNLEKSPDDL